VHRERVDAREGSIICVMLKRVLAWIKARQAQPPTPADIEAQREAKRIEDDHRTTSIEERQVTRVTRW